MTQREIIENLRKQVEKATNVSATELSIVLSQGTEERNAGSGYNMVGYPEAPGHDYGRYTIYTNIGGKVEIAKFRLSQMLNCCGICVLHDIQVNADYRRKGIATNILEAAEKIASSLNYATLLATEKSNGPNMQGALTKSGMAILKTFDNKKSGNTVSIFIKSL